MKLLLKNPLLLAVLGALAIYLGASVPSRPHFERGDLLDYYVPVADYVGRSLAQGELPLWNPQGGCGFDQVGGAQAALFYPPTWINALLPVKPAMTLLVLLHLIWFLWGFQKWLGLLGVQSVPALAGATVVAFGIIAEAWWPPMFYTLAWTPWILWSIERRGGWHWSIFIGAVLVAMQVLAGFPQYFFYSMAVVGLYALVKSCRQKCVRPVTLLVVGALFGAGLAAGQLAVTSQYLKQCWRSSGPIAPAYVHYHDDDGYTAELAPRIKTTAKHAIRTAFNALDNQRPLNPRSLSSRSEFGYLGFFVPMAIGLALVSTRRWELFFFSIVGLGTIYLSLGYIGGPVPLYSWLAHSVPMFGAFRSPDRLQFWAAMAAGVLVAFGLNRLAAPAPIPRRVLLGTMVLGLSMVLVRLAAFWKTHQMADLFSLVGWFILVVGGVSLMMFTLRQSHQGENRFGPTAVGLLCLLLLGDCLLSGRYVARWQEHPGAFFSSLHGSHDETKVILNHEELATLAQELGPERAYVAEAYRPVMPGTALPPFRSLPFYEPMTPQRHFELHGALTDPDNLKPKFAAFNYWNIPPEPHRRWLDWCSVKRLVTSNTLAGAETNGWAARGQTTSGAYLYDNVRAVPRAALFAQPRWGTRDEALAEMVSTQPLLPSEGPLLEGTPSDEWARAAQAMGTSGSNGMGTVVWRVERPSRIELEVEAKRPMILLLSDSWFPGWECRVDGVVTPILKANFIHRAIEIFPGRHQVSFAYEPVGMRLGLKVSLATLLFLVTACGTEEIRQRKIRPRSTVIKRPDQLEAKV